MLVLLAQVLLSLGSINAFIVIILIMLLVVAAAGVNRGFSLFNLFGVATLANVNPGGKSSIAGKSGFSVIVFTWINPHFGKAGAGKGLAGRMKSLGRRGAQKLKDSVTTGMLAGGAINRGMQRTTAGTVPNAPTNATQSPAGKPPRAPAGKAPPGRATASGTGSATPASSGRAVNAPVGTAGRATQASTPAYNSRSASFLLGKATGKAAGTTSRAAQAAASATSSTVSSGLNAAKNTRPVQVAAAAAAATGAAAAAGYTAAKNSKTARTIGKSARKAGRLAKKFGTVAATPAVYAAQKLAAGKRAVVRGGTKYGEWHRTHRRLRKAAWKGVMYKKNEQGIRVPRSPVRAAHVVAQAAKVEKIKIGPQGFNVSINVRKLRSQGAAAMKKLASGTGSDAFKTALILTMFPAYAAYRLGKGVNNINKFRKDVRSEPKFTGPRNEADRIFDSTYSATLAKHVQDHGKLRWRDRRELKKQLKAELKKSKVLKDVEGYNASKPPRTLAHSVGAGIVAGAVAGVSGARKAAEARREPGITSEERAKRPGTLRGAGKGVREAIGEHMKKRPDEKKGTTSPSLRMYHEGVRPPVAAFAQLGRRAREAASSVPKLKSSVSDLRLARWKTMEAKRYAKENPEDPKAQAAVEAAKQNQKTARRKVTENLKLRNSEVSGRPFRNRFVQQAVIDQRVRAINDTANSGLLESHLKDAEKVIDDSKNKIAENNDFITKELKKREDLRDTAGIEAKLKENDAHAEIIREHEKVRRAVALNGSLPSGQAGQRKGPDGKPVDLRGRILGEGLAVKQSDLKDLNGEVEKAQTALAGDKDNLELQHKFQQAKHNLEWAQESVKTSAEIMEKGKVPYTLSSAASVLKEQMAEASNVLANKDSSNDVKRKMLKSHALETNVMAKELLAQIIELAASDGDEQTRTLATRLVRTHLTKAMVTKDDISKLMHDNGHSPQEIEAFIAKLESKHT